MTDAEGTSGLNGDVAFDEGRIAALELGTYSWCHFDDRDEGMPCDETVRGVRLWIDGRSRYFREDGLLRGFGPQDVSGRAAWPRRVRSRIAWTPDGAVVALINTRDGGVSIRVAPDGTSQIRPASEAVIPAPHDRPVPALCRFQEAGSIGAAWTRWTGEIVGPAVRVDRGFDTPAMSSLAHDGDRVVLAWIGADFRPALRSLRLPELEQE